MRFLVDTGATVCVFGQEWIDMLQKTSPGSIVFRKIARKVTIVLAVGNSQSLDVMAIVEAKFNGHHVYLAGLIVPRLTENVLLGGNFFLTYQAHIDYGSLTLSLTLPGDMIVIIPLSKAARRFSIHSVDADPEKTPELFSLDHEQEFSDLSLYVEESGPRDERSEILNQLKNKLHEAINEGVITSEQAKVALRRLCPYVMVFRERLGTWKGDPINLRFKATEAWTTKKYSYPRVYQKAIDEEVKRLMELGVLVKSNTQYIHPVVVVPKGDGSIRICVDAAAFNRIVCEEHHDPPRIESFLFDESLGGIFSSFDFYHGYLQIMLAVETSKFLGIQINGETYEYRRMPFGTKVSGSVFNRIVREVIFRGVGTGHVKVYVDDVKVQSADFDSHLSLIEKILSNVLESGMTLSMAKTELFRSKLKFLGHKISDGVIAKNFEKGVFFEKFEKMYFKNSKFNLPTKRSVQQLVGFLNWYSRFIPKFSILISPILDLLSGGTPLKVSETHEAAYYELKREFFRDFELKQPKFGEPFYLVLCLVDNSMAGSLFQNDDEGRANIITMVNCRLPVTMSEKPKIVKVLYSLYYVLKRYKDLLLGYRIKLGVKTLAALHTVRDFVEVNGVCAKWYVFINSFNIDPEGYESGRFEDTFQVLRQFELIAQMADCEPACSFFEPDNESCEVAECNSLSERWERIRIAVTGADHDVSELLYNLFENIEAHQKTDPFCSKILNQVRKDENPKFCVENGKLYKWAQPGVKLLVIPEHAILDLIVLFHECYIHAGVEKTTALIKRQYYYKNLKRHVASTLSGCITCKHNKNSNQPIRPKRDRIQASYPGEVLSVDVFGPLPLKRGGIVAVFVALDRLSGHVSYQPLRSMKAESFIRAMAAILDCYDSLDIRVKTVLSDNAKQFRSNNWVEYLHESEIKPAFTACYNPKSNPTERAMRDLGEKIRICLNSQNRPASDHSKWHRELQRIQKVLNALPKAHGYTPNQILGITDYNPLPIPSDEIQPPDPHVLIEDRISGLVEKVLPEEVHLVRKSAPYKFPYDDRGRVHLFCDGAVAHKEADFSAIAVWVAQGHRANMSHVVVPSLTNNQAEICAIVEAIKIAFGNRLDDIVIHTDSAYVTDLLNEGLLSDSNPKFDTYLNYPWLSKLAEVMGSYGKEKISLNHVPGHTVDFGNLEVDYMAQTVIREYRSWVKIKEETRSRRERIWAYVANHKNIEFERDVHHSLISEKPCTEYQEGDIVAVRQHKLSQAYYGDDYVGREEMSTKKIIFHTTTYNNFLNDRKKTFS
jgi:ribonuclease HI